MRFLLVAFASASLALPAFAVAPIPPEKQPPPKLDRPTREAIDKALKYLKEQQSSDGSWGKTAFTAFALMAFMSNGSGPDKGEYGPEVAKGVRSLLAACRDDGYIAGAKGGDMYCHGLATLALSQAYGLTKDEEIKKALKKAVDLIVKTQNFEGGWRYDPAPTGADISITAAQVSALRAAKECGIDVSDDIIIMKKALAYINRCRDARSGGYRYQPGASGPGYTRSAVAIRVLQLCGNSEAKEITIAVKYMEQVGDDRVHYWYGHYYAAHALHEVGGKTWEDYYNRVKTDLLSKQRSTGEWSDPREQRVGPIYQTSIAVLVLSEPIRPTIAEAKK